MIVEMLFGDIGEDGHIEVDTIVSMLVDTMAGDFHDSDLTSDSLCFG